jgi:branched-chain amino acid transport system permease protein
MVQILGQVLLNSLMLGSAYCLVAIGLTLIISIMRIVNFAHGQLYMLGAMAVFLFYNVWKINFFVALSMGVVSIAVLGVLIERIFLRRIRVNEIACMLVTLGLGLILETGTVLLFGKDDMGIISPYAGVFKIGPLYLGRERAMVITFSLAAIGCLFLFLNHTKTGRAIRAFAQDNDAAILQGIDINRLSWVGFAIGAGMAALAGGLLAPVYWINPFIGNGAIINAFIVMVIGGLGSIPGTLLGGLILGAIDSFGRQFLPGSWAQAVTYSMVIIILIVRPKGLFGYEE